MKRLPSNNRQPTASPISKASPTRSAYVDALTLRSRSFALEVLGNAVLNFTHLTRVTLGDEIKLNG